MLSSEEDYIFEGYSAQIKAWLWMNNPEQVKIHPKFGVDVYVDGYYGFYVCTVHSMDTLVAVTQGFGACGQTNCSRESDHVRIKRNSRQPKEFKRQLLRHKRVRRLRKERREDRPICLMTDKQWERAMTR